MPKELKSLHADNFRKVAEYLGIDPDGNSSSELTHNTAAIDFLEQYKKHLTSTNKKLLREFYEQTGLILMNDIICPTEEDGPFEHHDLTMYGFMHSEDGIRNHHLTAEIYQDIPLELDDEDYYEHDYNKDTERCGFSNEDLKILTKDPKMILDDKLEHCYRTGPRKTLVGEFGEKFELKNGELFRDGRKIEEDVKTLFRLDDCNIYIIFEDNHVEYLEYHEKECATVYKYQKILYGPYFIAMLRDDKWLELILVDDKDDNTNYELFFDNVDDIEFDADKGSYKDETGDFKIKSGENFVSLHIGECQPLVRHYKD